MRSWLRRRTRPTWPFRLAPTIRRIYDWTGIYVGGHIGGGMLTDSVSQNGPATLNLLSSGSWRPAGVIGGAQAGANYEFAPWVVGIELGLVENLSAKIEYDFYDFARKNYNFSALRRSASNPICTPLSLASITGSIGRAALNPSPRP